LKETVLIPHSYKQIQIDKMLSNRSILMLLLLFIADEMCLVKLIFVFILLS